MNYDYLNLPREAHIKMRDLVTNKHHRGLVSLSEMTIRRLIEEGSFPRPRRYAGTRMVYFVYGEVLDWLNEQNKR